MDSWGNSEREKKKKQRLRTKQKSIKITEIQKKRLLNTAVLMVLGTLTSACPCSRRWLEELLFQ